MTRPPRRSAPTFAPPPFSANDWPRLRDVLTALLTVALLLAWLFALAVAWVQWTRRSELESVVLVVLAAAVLLTGGGFVRALFRQRRRYARLARDGAWWVATVTEIERGHDPTGVAIGVPYQWIVTATAAGPDGQVHVFRAAPIRRLRDVRELRGKKVWARVDPGDPGCHVLLPLAPAGE